MKKITVIILLLFAFGCLFAQIPSPAPAQKEKILLLNGYAHLGNGQVIENSAIAFENGKITMVADARTIRLDMAHYDKVIRIEGKHVYPGMIATNSTLGLTEVESIRATLDFKEVGEFNPHVRSAISYNTDSKIIPTVRSNGVLLGQITPNGGLVSGTSSVMQFDAWNWEDAMVKADEGVHLNWPRIYQRSGWWAEPGEIKKNEKYGETIKQIEDFFKEAEAYEKLKEVKETNLRFEAMKGLFTGEKTLYIHVNMVKEITQAVEFKRTYNIKKMAIVGGYDSWMVADVLRENGVSVILDRLHELPKQPEDDIDMNFKIPYLLKKANVLFCLNNDGDMEAMQTRNLPFLAGTAAAYGLTKEEALMSITLNSAKILGIDAAYGSIENGKSATLFVSEGDALDMRTNNVIHAFIDGRNISLDNPQKQLYEKFNTKYGE